MTITDICNDFYEKTDTNSTSYANADLLRNINTAYDRVSSLVLIAANDRWQWDDLNNTDLPIATTSTVNGQQDYSLASAHLTIDRVEIQDANGNWRELDPITQQALKRASEVALENYYATNGTPVRYQLVGNSIFLYPIPNYVGTLKIYFTRGPNYFVIGDIPSGSKTPGFNQLFHQLLSLWPAYDYCLVKMPDRAPQIFQKIELLEQSIEDFYGTRFHDYRARLTTSNTSGGGSQTGVLGTYGGDSNK